VEGNEERDGRKGGTGLRRKGRKDTVGLIKIQMRQRKIGGREGGEQHKITGAGEGREG
jgi:hypothetical protein